MLTLYEQDEYLASEMNAPSWFFFLIWLGWIILTIAGYLAGKWLADGAAGFFLGNDPGPRVLSLEGTVRDVGILGYPIALLCGALYGAARGAAQALLLLPFLKMAGAIEWWVATILGGSVQWLVIYVIGVAMRGLTIDQTWPGIIFLYAILMLTGLLSGAALGYPQGQLFKRRSRRSTWWIVATTLATVSTGFVISMTLLIESQNTLRDYSSLLTAILAAIATGFALLEVLHHPRAEAEWRETLSWEK